MDLEEWKSNQQAELVTISHHEINVSEKCQTFERISDQQEQSVQRPWGRDVWDILNSLIWMKQ